MSCFAGGVRPRFSIPSPNLRELLDVRGVRGLAESVRGEPHYTSLGVDITPAGECYTARLSFFPSFQVEKSLPRMKNFRPI
jgi:hypothetical protein